MPTNVAFNQQYRMVGGIDYQCMDRSRTAASLLLIYLSGGFALAMGGCRCEVVSPSRGIEAECQGMLRSANTREWIRFNRQRMACSRRAARLLIFPTWRGATGGISIQRFVRGLPVRFWLNGIPNACVWASAWCCVGQKCISRGWVGHILL